jgi:hypothetical protein
MNDLSKRPDLPNLDLIQAVQRARMAHDAEATPSQVSNVYWIEFKRAVDGPAPTSRASRWVIETTLAEVDALWEQIKAATADGRLGYKSKVATISRTADSNARAIYVLTVDADDVADVGRVRASLLALGIPLANLRYERVHEEGG